MLLGKSMATALAKEVADNMTDGEPSICDTLTSRQINREEEEQMYTRRMRKSDPIPSRFNEIFFGKRSCRFWDSPQPQCATDQVEFAGVQPSSSSSYVLADDQSRTGRDFGSWANDSGGNNHQAVQSIRVPQTQRSVMTRQSLGMEHSGLWYFMALLLPLFSMSGCPRWRCTPSLVINTMELLVTHVSRLCVQARGHFRVLAQDRVARDLFATAMDIVLVIYAIGFLVLNMYQAAVYRTYSYLSSRFRRSCMLCDCGFYTRHYRAYNSTPKYRKW